MYIHIHIHTIYRPGSWPCM